MSKELEKAQHAIRELTVEMNGTEYEEFMRQLAEWAYYQAETANWHESDE